MSDKNVVTATITLYRAVTTHPLYQYDYGQVLMIEGVELPQVYEVHFANQETGGTTITQIGGADGVSIPDELLLSGSDIWAFLFLHEGDDDGETEYKIHIPVKERPQPSDEEPTPVEQSAITQAIAALNDAVESTGADAASAREDADRAESYAVGGTGTRQDEDIDNAKYYSELAAQSAETAGYAWFDIDDSDGEMYVTVANNLDNDLTFAIDEASGELEVIIK